MKLAIVTCKKYPELAESDRPLIPLFAGQQIIAEPAIWNSRSVDWKTYDAILLRSPWDYHLNLDAFNAWLNMLEEKDIYVLNPVSTLRWNLHKFYLKELQEKGIEIIPTIFMDKTAPLDFSEAKALVWHKVAIKPAVSAGAHLTHAFEIESLESMKHELKLLNEHGDMLLQPFMHEVIEQGEISMLFFNRKFSHAVLKRPAFNDFRVQKEHGGITKAYIPDHRNIETAANILNLIPGELLYARVDGVLKDNRFILMELELLEPFLFFDYLTGTMESFVAETCRMMRGKA